MLSHEAGSRSCDLAHPSGHQEIFYPSIPYERKEFPDANNHYNCPIVTSYPENIKNNIDELRDDSIHCFRHPFLNLKVQKPSPLGLTKEFRKSQPLKSKRLSAWPGTRTGKTREAMWEKRTGNLKMAERQPPATVSFWQEDCTMSIPRSTTVSRSSSIPCGVAVLTEDSISNLNEPERPLIVMDQWMYHSRLYAAANYVKN